MGAESKGRNSAFMPRRLRNTKRSIKRRIDSRENLHSYIQLQTTRKLSLNHGDLPITEMHRGTKRTSYIPFLLRGSYEWVVASLRCIKTKRIENPFLFLLIFRGSQILLLFLLGGLFPGSGLILPGFSRCLAFLLSCGAMLAYKSWGSGNMPGRSSRLPFFEGDGGFFLGGSRSSPAAAESSHVPQEIFFNETSQDEIWAALEVEERRIGENIVRNQSQETSLRQRLNSFGKEESPFLLGQSKYDYWNEIQSTLGAASTQVDYNHLLDFENLDLEIRELKNQCFSLLKAELEQHSDLLSRCIERNPEEGILSFLDDQREELEAELKAPDGRFVDSRSIDQLEIHTLKKIRKDLLKKEGLSYFFYKLIQEYFPFF